MPSPSRRLQSRDIADSAVVTRSVAVQAIDIERQLDPVYAATRSAGISPVTMTTTTGGGAQVITTTSTIPAWVGTMTFIMSWHGWPVYAPTAAVGAYRFRSYLYRDGLSVGAQLGYPQSTASGGIALSNTMTHIAGGTVSAPGANLEYYAKADHSAPSSTLDFGFRLFVHEVGIR